ncbi:MAG TPA: response regulator [Thermoanaerobaculia bacterium]|nr:response regulator [Thermoanaerobaculia bacterium]
MSDTIFVVDDDPDLRRLLRTLLPAAGFGVLDAANSREAIQVFRAHANGIVAVLLDMRMAGGEETFTTPRPDVRGILSSGYEESEATRRFNTPGLAGFLQKPYIASELTARLLEALEGERKTA